MRLKIKGIGGSESRAVRLAAVFGLSCCLLAGLVSGNATASMAAGLLCFLAAFAAMRYYPKARRRNYARRVEADLPMCLMGIALELNLHMPFLKALENASKGEGCFSAELKIALAEVREHGASVPEALRHLGERIESRLVRRAIAQLVSAFEQGNSENCGQPVKRIALEVLERQKVESRLFSGKLVVFSLLFIAVSAIVPALFQSFSILGAAVLEIGFSPEQLFLIVAAGFPLLDLSVLLYIRQKTPVFMRCG